MNERRNIRTHLMFGLVFLTLLRIPFEQQIIKVQNRTLSDPNHEVLASLAMPQTSASDLSLRDERNASSSALIGLLQSLNVSQILRLFEDQPLQYQEIAAKFPRPHTDDLDTIAIYSHAAWLQLRRILLTRDSTMVVSAGSSLTGAGVVDSKGRCQQIFADHFKNVTVIDRAHGGRNSFHSTQLMHSFFPKQADVILWEFAINDGVNNAGNSEITRKEQRNQLILFLDQVARVAKDRRQDPPLVILLYLWTTPFTISSGRINDSHRHLAENYDFVVGHINAASYVSSWQLGQEEAKAVALDHPSARGHMILAYLLHDFVMNEQRRQKPKEIERNSNQLYVAMWE